MVQIYDLKGRYIDKCDNERARRLVLRNKAYWVDLNSIKLAVSKDKVYKKKPISKDKREIILKEEKGVCYICGSKKNKEEVTIDHLISLHDGGTNYRKNLKCCCARCNTDKDNLSLPDYYKHLTKNRDKYGYISDNQLKKIKKLVDSVSTEFPRIKGVIDEENSIVDIYINDKGRIKISNNDDIDKIAIEVYKLLKAINGNYILDIIN